MCRPHAPPHVARLSARDARSLISLNCRCRVRDQLAFPPLTIVNHWVHYTVRKYFTRYGREGKLQVFCLKQASNDVRKPSDLQSYIRVGPNLEIWHRAFWRVTQSTCRTLVGLVHETQGRQHLLYLLYQRGGNVVPKTKNNLETLRMHDYVNWKRGQEI